MEEGRGGRGEGQERAARGGKGRSANERGLVRSKKNDVHLLSQVYYCTRLF